MDQAAQFLIKLQQQPTPFSCVTACMAMLCNRPVADLMEEGVDHRYQADNMSLAEMLNELQIEFQSFNTCDRNSLSDESPGAYLLVVPSLNIVAGNHQIVLEMGLDGDWAVLDPNEGKDGKRYFTGFPPQNDLQHMLGGGYTVEAFIPRRHLELVYLQQEIE